MGQALAGLSSGGGAELALATREYANLLRGHIHFKKGEGALFPLAQAKIDGQTLAAMAGPSRGSGAQAHRPGAFHEAFHTMIGRFERLSTLGLRVSSAAEVLFSRRGHI
jgi:hypothetical protein